MKKYEKVFRHDYEQWYQEQDTYRKEVADDSRRLHFHLMPETGWLNDPNGLCQFKGVYHIYYQYSPFEPTGELKLWGHFTTRDFVHYNQEEPFLYPDTDADAHGAYSGSAFVEDGNIHYFYTGNVKQFDREDYDYIMSGRVSNTIHFTSADGYHISPKEVILNNSDYPSDMSCHIRDPKILKTGGAYYMVLGARDAESRGMMLMYRSDDLEHWTFYQKIQTKEPFGYMWECPDLFYLDGQLCLISCPQGVEPRGVDFENIHQCTVMKMDFDFEHNTYEIDDVKDIRLLDRGFDFYAPQTFEDEKGRRILIGWMGIPDADYTNPTVSSGWQHALTLPRELHFKNGRLIQVPLEELKELRRSRHTCEVENSFSKPDSPLVYEAELAFTSCSHMEMTLRDGVRLIWKDGLMTLDLGTCGAGRTCRKVELNGLRDLRIFSDTTSLEIFVNGGTEVFTSRVYGDCPDLELKGEFKGTIDFYEIGEFQIKDLH
ncbi:sucrose-6-phosphate hydrolase [Clostridium sp. MCC353]|uniref:glycoside hydrolase family 32 protein n=1 Tax=Clostridium sp. MCC353 TaxID=2592646 RepID=UPI001C033258|nr:glycoside hydrolase family 32 protein [Clostridium sp. MCC353]MBT9778548.1 sucrose-6-phosphate hydrolase [Clostridium sp. MCC353]